MNSLPDAPPAPPCSAGSRRIVAWIGTALCIASGLAGVLSAGEPLRLTHDGRLKFSPAVSANPNEVVFAVLEKPELYRLMRLKVAEGIAEPLHDETIRPEFEPAFSPDGRYFVFLRTVGALHIGVVIRDEQTRKEHFVEPPPGFAGLRSPSVSPTKSRVLFSLADANHQQIHSVNLEGEDRRTLTNTGIINNWPSFNPEGTQIVFGSMRDGNFEIYLMREDGSDVRRLTDNPFQDIRPKFSPDGQRIAFTSGRDGNYEVYVMRSDGSDVRRVTNHPERDDYPTWHPDGKRLVIVSERSGRHDLYLVDVP